MDVIMRNKSLYLCLLFCIINNLIILTNSVEFDNNVDNNNIHNMIDTATHPTQETLDDLLYYKQAWQQIKIDKKFYNTYTFTFSWDTLDIDDDPCYSVNKYIYVEDNIIQQEELKISTVNMLTSRFKSCNEGNSSSLDITDYETIDELYNKTINWFKQGLNSGDIESYRVVELLINNDYLFPESVKLLDGDNNWIAWDIICFRPFYIENENDLCDLEVNSGEVKELHISHEMQSFLGGGIIFLILVGCSLGYCINWIKKKKTAKIDAWRKKEENLKKEREKQREEREKQRAERKHHRRRRSKDKREKKKSHHKKRNSKEDINMNNKNDNNNNNDYHELKPIDEDGVNDDRSSTDELLSVIDEQQIDESAEEDYRD